jgi:hypothetical protein
MTDYVLNKKPEPASNDMVWAFDLGHPLRLERGEDRGEVSNPDNQKTKVNPAFQFLHKPPGSSQRNLPKPKPPPVAAGCGARDRHTRRASNGWPLNTKFDVARLWSSP